MLPPPPSRLQAALTDLLALEGAISRRIDQLRERATGCGPVRDILSEIAALACAHIAALRERLQDWSLRGDADAACTLQPAVDLTFSGLHPGSTALRDAYAIVQQAIIGYSLIQPITHRMLDSWAMADHGTSAHIARQHTQDYVRAAGRIMAVIHDVAVSELDAAGLVCQCTCPACGIGACVCALSGRGIFAEALLAARPPVAEHGIELHPPRPGSEAARAGLREGDVIVAVDGERVDAPAVFQRLIRDHESSDHLAFTVRRRAGDVTIPVRRQREDADPYEAECVLVSGQPFYLAQAKDVQRRLRRRNGEPAESGAGLASLSPREVQVLRLLTQGATNPIIADALAISRATVANHVANVLRKLGLANRTEAAGLAAHERLMSDA